MTRNPLRGRLECSTALDIQSPLGVVALAQPLSQFLGVQYITSISLL